MYSVGYVFFYGMSLITRSYVVLYASLAAHLCQVNGARRRHRRWRCLMGRCGRQLAFLAAVENPHIEKVYHTTPPYMDEAKRRIMRRYFRSDLIVLKNLDLFRAPDLFLAVIIVYAIATYFMPLPWWFYVTQAMLFRVMHTTGLGLVLYLQSRKRWWTRHFLQRGYSKDFAFSQWKSIYNASLTVTYVTFVVLGMRMYELPDNWTVGPVLAMHTIGVMLILIHLWASVSMYEVLGDFGYFYGDFFIDEYQPEVYYHGIYRFFNNPEKVVGYAGFYGVALISGSLSVLVVALASQLLWAAFLHTVESPHMARMYGNKLRAESGLTAALLERSSKLRKSLTETRLKMVQPLQDAIRSKAEPVRAIRDRDCGLRGGPHRPANDAAVVAHRRSRARSARAFCRSRRR